MTPSVLFEDPHLIAVDKPAGLLTQGAPGGEPTLEAALRAYLPAGAYLGTVHRLDRPVSGVVLWAKTRKAARRLSAQFASRATLKEYRAVCERGPGPSAVGFVWEDWLTTTTDSEGVVRRVAAGTAGARRALTRVEAVADAPLPERIALRLWPETGRTHQLRAQAAARGLPIVGDHAYGAREAFPGGIALHARSLRFEHPVTRLPLTVTAPFPKAWGCFGFAGAAE